MRTYKSSDLTNNKRAEVFREAEANGVIIQQCRTNGDVISEMILVDVNKYQDIADDVSIYTGISNSELTC